MAKNNIIYKISAIEDFVKSIDNMIIDINIDLKNIKDMAKEIREEIEVTEDELPNKCLTDDEDLKKLRVGDYISIPMGDDKFELYKIINLEEHYLLLSEKDNSILSQTFYSLDEVVQFINIKEDEYDGGSTIYRVKDDFTWQTDERYLIYDKNYFEDFEVLVSRNINDNMYEVVTPSGDDYFLEERFTTIDELTLHLHKEFGLIKQLRYSEYQ